MKTKSFQVVLFLVAVSVCLTPAAHATPENREIIVGFNNVSWPPYLVEETNGKIHGIMMDVMKAIASKHGFSVKITPLPEKRAIRGMAQGDIDAYSKAKEWVQNPNAYLWTDPVVDSTDVLIFPKDRPVHFETPDDLDGKKIGAILGYRYPLLEPYFADGRIKRDDVKKDSLMLAKLLRGRDDAAIINKFVAYWVIRQNPEFKDKFAFSEKPVGEAGCRFMFTPKQNWGPFIEAFNKELTSMKGDGRLDAIVRKYQ
jgi:polar amino acid transport system substrate-binding protein